MSYLTQRKNKIQTYYGVSYVNFIKKQILFGLSSLYIQHFSDLPRIIKKDYKNSEISYYCIDCKELKTVAVDLILAQLKIKYAVLFYCNFPDNFPSAQQNDEVIYIRSPIEESIELKNLFQNMIFEFSRTSRLLKITIKQILTPDSSIS